MESQKDKSIDTLIIEISQKIEIRCKEERNKTPTLNNCYDVFHSYFGFTTIEKEDLREIIIKSLKISQQQKLDTKDLTISILKSLSGFLVHKKK